MHLTIFNRKVLWLLTALLFFAATFYSCKKVDIKPNYENVIERFLKLPDNASPQLIRIIEDLKVKEKEHPFIEQFVVNVGYPLWKYAEIKRDKPTGNLLAREVGDEIVEIPIVLDEKQFVNALLEVKLDIEVLYKLIESSNWVNYGFDKEAAINADKIVAKMMQYEKVIWNSQVFKIDDNRLFDYWHPGVEKPSSFFIELQTNPVNNDKVMYVYGDCEGGNTGGGDTGGGDNGDGNDWTYANGGQLTGFAPDKPYTWTEPNSPGSPGSPPSAPKPICLTDIIHIEENAPGSSGWSSTIISSGGSNGGGSSSGDGPCTPFPWAGLATRGSGPLYTLFNPCLEEVPPGVEPTDLGDDPCATAKPLADAAKTLSQTQVFNTAKTEITTAASDGNEHAVTFGKTGSTITRSIMTTGSTSEGSVDTNLSGAFADLHNHPNDEPPSAGDLYGLISRNNTHSNYNKRFVLAPDGSLYALVVVNLIKANTFVADHPKVQVPGYPPDFPDPVFTLLDNVKTSIEFGNVANGIIAEEMAMAYILDNYDSGIALLKQDNNGNFVRLRTKASTANGNITYSANNCN